MRCENPLWFPFWVALHGRGRKKWLRISRKSECPFVVVFYGLGEGRTDWCCLARALVLMLCQNRWVKGMINPNRSLLWTGTLLSRTLVGAGSHSQAKGLPGFQQTEQRRLSCGCVAWVQLTNASSFWTPAQTHKARSWKYCSLKGAIAGGRGVNLIGQAFQNTLITKDILVAFPGTHEAEKTASRDFPPEVRVPNPKQTGLWTTLACLTNLCTACETE